MYRTTPCDIKWESDSSSICDTSHWAAKWITFLTNQLTIHSMNYCVIWSTVPGMMNRMIEGNIIKTINFWTILHMISRDGWNQHTHKPTSNWLSGFISDLCMIMFNETIIQSTNLCTIWWAIHWMIPWGIWWKIQDSKVWCTTRWIIQCMIWRLIRWTVWWRGLWMNWWMVKGTLNNWCDSFY